MIPDPQAENEDDDGPVYRLTPLGHAHIAARDALRKLGVTPTYDDMSEVVAATVNAYLAAVPVPEEPREIGDRWALGPIGAMPGYGDAMVILHRESATSSEGEPADRTDDLLAALVAMVRDLANTAPAVPEEPPTEAGKPPVEVHYEPVWISAPPPEVQTGWTASPSPHPAPAVSDGAPSDEGETVTEWGVRYLDRAEPRITFPVSESVARELASDPDGTAYAFTRTVTYGPWHPAGEQTP